MEGVIGVAEERMSECRRSVLRRFYGGMDELHLNLFSERTQFLYCVLSEVLYPFIGLLRQCETDSYSAFNFDFLEFHTRGALLHDSVSHFYRGTGQHDIIIDHP